MNSVRIAALLDRRRRRHTRRQRSFLSRTQNAARALGTVLAVLAVLAGLLAGWVYTDLSSDLPSLQALPAMLASPDGLFLQPTRLYDRTGQHLIHTLAVPGVDRRFLPIDEGQPASNGAHLSPHLVRLAEAVLHPEESPRLAERLVGDLLLTEEPPGWRRDVRQRFLALQVTDQYGPQGVLEFFLNSVYLGHLAYGAEAAAQTYLGKSAASLNLAEAALLVSLVDTPALNPVDAPEAARQGQQTLLRQLVENGSIRVDEFRQAVGTPLEFRRLHDPLSLGSEGPGAPENAFVRRAIAELQTLLGHASLERGGWTVITTLDYELQQQADCTARAWMDRLASPEALESGTALQIGPADSASSCEAARLLPTLRPGTYSPQPESSLSASAVLLDPKTGQVLALVGEVSNQDQDSHLRSHPPGSLLTPFIYLAGFSRGFSPASLVWDIPSPGSEGSPVFNPDGVFHGPVRQRFALANDYWTPAAELLAELGPQEVWRQAASFGLPEEFASLEAPGSDGAPFPFEGGAIDLLEAVQAFGVFANQGVMAGQASPAAPASPLAPTTLLKVESAAGRQLVDYTKPSSRSIIGQPLAYLVNSVLGDGLARRTSLGYPNPLDIGRPAAAKLGRTASGSDTWAIGYTPSRVAGVWLGRAPVSSAQNDEDASPVDTLLAAGLWHALIQYAVRDLPADGWAAPSGIVNLKVCDPSGLLPTPVCPAVVDEVFLSGNQPVTYDTLYQEFQVNRETNRLATVFTPPEWIESRVYPVYPPEAQAWARQAGLTFAPDTYDAIQPPPPSPHVRLDQPEMFGVVSGKVDILGTAAGEDFAYYRLQFGPGINPQEWLQINMDNPQPVTSGKLAEWDTTGLGGLYALRLLVVRLDQQVQTATLQVTVDNTPPQAGIRYPAQGQVVEIIPGSEMTLLAQADDEIGIRQVEWLVDGLLVARRDQGPYHLSWDATPGSHTVQIRVTDLAGNVTESPPVEFSVDNQS